MAHIECTTLYCSTIVHNNLFMCIRFFVGDMWQRSGLARHELTDAMHYEDIHVSELPADSDVPVTTGMGHIPPAAADGHTSSPTGPSVRKLFTVTEPATEDTEDTEDHDLTPDQHAGVARSTQIKEDLKERIKKTGDKLAKPVWGAVKKAKIPVYPLLILINMLSFFAFGAMIAITSAPTPKAMHVLKSVAVHTAQRGLETASEMPKHAAHAAQDAVRATHMAYRVSGGAYKAAHTISDLQKKAEEGVLHAGYSVAKDGVKAGVGAARDTLRAAKEDVVQGSHVK